MEVHDAPMDKNFEMLYGCFRADQLNMVPVEVMHE